MVNFAQLEARSNTQVLTKLSNANVVFNGVTYRCIFEMLFAEEYQTDMSRPVITASAADFASAEQESALVVNGVNYTIADIQPDGSGLVQILLHKA